MSRSNPNTETVNPAYRWFEWDATEGLIRYYDKEAKQNVRLELPFTFLVLDEMVSITGFHEPSNSGIYSNEVRDTRKDKLNVRVFKGPDLANGFYAQIKDSVKAHGGKFTMNIYIAYKDGGQMRIGGLKFRGAAGSEWMNFKKNNRTGIISSAVKIVEVKEGKKGGVKFRSPVFKLGTVSPGTDAEALNLDSEILQPYLTAYLARNRSEQPESQESGYNAADENQEQHHEPDPDELASQDDDSVPF